MYEFLSYVLFCIIFFGYIVICPIIVKNKRNDTYKNLRYLKRYFTDLKIKK